MIEVKLDISAEQELEALHQALQRYGEVSKRDLTDTLHKKANDIRIELFRGYYAQRFRGTRKGSLASKGVAFAQMRRRAKSGQGVALRQSLQSGPASPKAPLEYFQRRKLRGANGTNRKLRVPVAMSNYQRRVWTELARRQAGIGVLGASFLMQRWNKKRTRLRSNRGGVAPLEVHTQQGYRNNELGRITLSHDFARIEGFVPGQAKIGARSSILAIALRNVRQDTEVYLKRKAEESIAAELKDAGINIT